MNRLTLLIVLLLSCLPALAAETLAIDPSHCAVFFSWDHLGYSHPVARLEKVVGSVTLDRSDPAKSSVSVTLPLDGLRTGDAGLDRRLRTFDFFDVAKYPEITFRSTKVETAGVNALKVTGDLFVHGVTKSVVLDATINRERFEAGQNPEVGFDASVVLRRSEFGVGRYVPMVPDDIVVHISLEARNE
jgi:polyisoprenoid-binding protein YceI